VATEALREVSAIGKEMIDGNSAVAAVASSIVMDSNVFPSRNSTRDKETTKEVVDAINKYGLIPAAGQTEVWKGSYFLEFKVGRAHALARWAICKACIANSTDVNDSIEDDNDFLVTASAAAAVNSLELSSAEIADREIKIWKTRTVPFPKDKNPLDEWRRGVVYLFPWLGVLARRVLAIPATSAAPERLFSTAGNVMTKKRSRLTCDNMEELVYLHEVWPQVREWEAVKKMRLE